MNKRLMKIFILLILSVFLLTACGEDETSQPAAQATKKTVKKKSGDDIPMEPTEQDVVQEYVYNPIGKRDPFENPLRAIVEVAPESGVPLTPLQKFDLGQLRLIGVIVGKGNPRAMIIAPDGKSFILSVGTKVGKNDGTVVEITTDAVLVKEKYYDFTGEVKTSVQEIMLPKQGGVK